MRAFDRSARFREGGEFDQDVALYSNCQRCSSCSSERYLFLLLLPTQYLSLEYMMEDRTHLDVPTPPIQIHVHILDLAVLAKDVLQILFAGFFVYVCRDYDPALDTTDCRGAGRCACVRGRIAVAVVVGGAVAGGVGRFVARVEVHFCGFGHCGIEWRNW